MTMPGDITFNSGTSYFGQNLTDFVQNGTIAASRVDDMAERILAAWYLLRQDSSSYPEGTSPSFRGLSTSNFPIAVNFNAFFPLDQATNEHVDVQDDHFTVVREIGAAGAVLLKNEGALPLLKPRSVIVVGNDSGPSIYGPNGFSDRQGDDGILAMGWGSGTAQFPYLIDPLSAIQNRAIKDHSIVSWWRSNWQLPGVAAAVQQQSAAASISLRHARDT